MAETSGSQGVPKETPKRHTLDALDAAMKTAGLAPVGGSLKRDGYFEASLLEQGRMAVRASFAACSSAKERSALLKALMASPVGNMRGHAAGFAFLCYGDDPKRCAKALFAIGILEGVWPQESAQTELKRLMNRHGVAAVLPLCEGWLWDTRDAARRLLIEAMRPRGVWTGHLAELRHDPAPLRAVLGAVLDDPSRYVQNAAANCLNDVSKDHPVAACAWASEWLAGEPSAARAYIVKRGLRTLVKDGHAAALSIMGYRGAEKLEATWGGKIPKKVALGDALRIAFVFGNPGRKEARVVVKVEMEGPGKGQKPRVARYHVGEADVPPGGRVEVATSIRFQNRNSQPKLPGAYTVISMVNGTELRRDRFSYSLRD